MLVNNSVKIWNIDGKLLLVANDQDDDELGLLIWSAENVELDNTQLDHIIEKWINYMVKHLSLRY